MCLSTEKLRTFLNHLSHDGINPWVACSTFSQCSDMFFVLIPFNLATNTVSFHLNQDLSVPCNINHSYLCKVVDGTGNGIKKFSIHELTLD